MPHFNNRVLMLIVGPLLATACGGNVTVPGLRFIPESGKQSPVTDRSEHQEQESQIWSNGACCSPHGSVGGENDSQDSLRDLEWRDALAQGESTNSDTSSVNR